MRPFVEIENKAKPFALDTLTGLEVMTLQFHIFFDSVGKCCSTVLRLPGFSWYSSSCTSLHSQSSSHKSQQTLTRNSCYPVYNSAYILQSPTIASFKEVVAANTMRSPVKLIFLITLWLFASQTVFLLKLGDRMNQLSIEYHALVTEMYLHGSHSTEPYSKDILERMITVKEQMHDVIGGMRCLEKTEPDSFCLALLSEEKRLGWEVLSVTNGKAKKGVESGQKYDGSVIVEEADVENAGP